MGAEYPFVWLTGGGCEGWPLGRRPNGDGSIRSGGAAAIAQPRRHRVEGLASAGSIPRPPFARDMDQHNRPLRATGGAVSWRRADGAVQYVGVRQRGQAGFMAAGNDDLGGVVSLSAVEVVVKQAGRGGVRMWCAMVLRSTSHGGQ